MPAPAGAFSIFPHCRSSACSRRSFFYISPLPQQCLLPQERYLFFPTAAAVPAPAGSFSIFPHCRSSARSRRSPIYISPLPQQCLFPHQGSPPNPNWPTPLTTVHPDPHSNLPSPLPNPPPLSPNPPPSPFQQCPLQQEPFLYFPTAAAVPAPAGAFSTFTLCRSSVHSRRSLFYISPLPQQCPLPQEPFLYFPTAAAVSTPTFSIPPHVATAVHASAEASPPF